MSNVLKVLVNGNINTLWAPQPMGEVRPFTALLARKRQEIALIDTNNQEELRLLLEEFRQEPTDKRKRDLLWHITCHM